MLVVGGQGQGSMNEQLSGLKDLTDIELVRNWGTSSTCWQPIFSSKMPEFLTMTRQRKQAVRDTGQQPGLGGENLLFGTPSDLRGQVGD